MRRSVIHCVSGLNALGFTTHLFLPLTVKMGFVLPLSTVVHKEGYCTSLVTPAQSPGLILRPSAGPELHREKLQGGVVDWGRVRVKFGGPVVEALLMEKIINFRCATMRQ